MMFSKMQLIAVFICVTVIWNHSDAGNSECNLPASHGKCRGSFPRWFFNKKTKNCEKFIYGGCEGNANRFTTEMACKKACDRCYQPAVTGQCLALFRRYYYDYNDGKCKEFTYGGCLGNANNFKTKIKCEEACDKSSG